MDEVTTGSESTVKLELEAWLLRWPYQGKLKLHHTADAIRCLKVDRPGRGGSVIPRRGCLRSVEVLDMCGLQVPVSPMHVGSRQLSYVLRSRNVADFRK